MRTSAVASAAGLGLCMVLTVLITSQVTAGMRMRQPRSGSGTFQLDVRNTIGLTIAFLVASMAASAGVGGGAFFVPLAMVFMKFSLKEATVLSQACITAVSAASIIFNLHKRHPVYPATKTLIDYEMLLTFTPPLLVGVSVGVVFNASFPTWLITTMLITMLAFMSVRTTQKGIKQWGNETQHRQQAAAAAEAATAVPPGPPQASGATNADQQAQNNPAAVVIISDELDMTRSKPKPAPYPAAMLSGVVFLWFGFSALQLLRQRNKRCSAAYFAVCGLQVLFGACCAVLFAYFCVARPARRHAAAEVHQPLLSAPHSQLLEQQRIQQQQSMARLIVTACKVAVAGVVAGVLGIGGGMIMAPLLLEIGIHPLSTSATSNILVFMCSSSATLAFLLDGRVDLHYSAVYCAVCGVASLMGLTVMGRLVARSGRPSIVILLLAFIMCAGALCSGVFGYIEAWHQSQAGTGGFRRICYK